jgi:hypothetical protein
MREYLDARLITTPFGLFDCDVPCDGAVAVIVSAVGAARDLARPPVLVEAVGTHPGFARAVFVLARTDPSVPKHKGLTLFLVPTASPGFELRPIHTLGGQVTNATFYSDVQVPDSARIGGGVHVGGVPGPGRLGARDAAPGRY